MRGKTYPAIIFWQDEEEILNVIATHSSPSPYQQLWRPLQLIGEVYPCVVLNRPVVVVVVIVHAQKTNNN